EGGAGAGGDDPRQRRLAASRRPVEDHRADAVLLDRKSQRRAVAKHMTLTDELLERRRTGALGERRRPGHLLPSRIGKEVAHRAKYAQPMSRREQTGLEDELGPILPGPGASDYERYIRTDELLALQKSAHERAHHDELLFQITHQSSELWLK